METSIGLLNQTSFSLVSDFMPERVQDMTSEGLSMSNNTNISMEFTETDSSGKAFFETAKFINGVILYPVICFPGIIGNILTLIVLSRKNMCTSTNAFLSALAVADTVKLINDIIYFCVMVLSRTNPSAAHTAYVHIYPYAHFVFSLSVCLSAWLTVSVAVERYILVCHPTRARSLCTRNRAIVTSAVVYIVMVGLAVPCAFRYRRVENLDKETNQTKMEVVETLLWKDNDFMMYYNHFLNFLRCFIPLLILIYLNTCIINALRKTRAKKKHAQRNRVTFMMLTVIMVFLFCITPDAVITLLDLGYHEEQNYYARGVREFSDMLLAVNAAVNFVIYCVLSRTFRQNFTSLFCNHGTQRKSKTETPWYRRLSDQSSFWNNKKRRRSSSV